MKSLAKINRIAHCALFLLTTLGRAFLMLIDDYHTRVQNITIYKKRQQKASFFLTSNNKVSLVVIWFLIDRCPILAQKRHTL